MTDHDISGHPAEVPESAEATDSAEVAPPEAVPTAEDAFEILGLRPELLKTIADLGYEEPTPIQRETIPHLLAGRDLLGQAATGTGKTAAFALPVLQQIDTAAKVVPFALILVPTRELAMQVSEAIFKYGRGLNVKVTPIYGGQPIFRQLQALDRGVHIVVATPGRALDHIGRGSLHLGEIRTVILDEADEMLDMGFADDIDAILQATPSERQTVLFSATMPARINALARKYQRDPVRIQIGRGDTQPGTALVRQSAYMVQRAHKPAALGRILDIEAPKATLVFCRTRTEVDQLTETMNGRGYRAEALHGGMDQPQRDRVMGRLRDGTAELLVATDVAARGLDVDTLTHVVNYDVPSAAESYVHRIGRVGRAGRQGVAITLAEPREQRLLFNIEKLTKQKIAIERVPTVADLRARQIEQTVAAVREALASDDLDDYNDVLNALSGDHNIRTIALAAVKLAHEAGGATVDEAEIPDFSHKVDRNPRPDRPERGDRPGQKGPRPSPGHRGGTAGTAFIYVSLGRKANIRAGDLVGLIANESNLTGREIGPIKITENFSIVGVPEGRVDDVIGSLRNTMLKGKRPNARRYTD